MITDADNPLTDIAFCWTLERRDGAGLATTSHDQALWVGGIRHEPSPGLMPAAVSKGDHGEPAGEIGGAVTSEALRQEDLVAGRWDRSLSRLTAVSWEAPDNEAVELVAGELGDVHVDGTAFQADLLGASSALNATVCPITSPECRATLGDKKCRVNMADRTLRATVIASSVNEVVIDQLVDQRFVKGRLRWLNGANCGLKAAISSSSGATLQLRQVPPLPVQVGDRVLLFEGCDKRLETCRTRFGNVANFRGEPHLPGNDLLTRYPGA